MPVTASATRFRERIEALEERWLSPLAARSYPARRAVPEEDSPLRTPFQRDRPGRHRTGDGERGEREQKPP